MTENERVSQRWYAAKKSMGVYFENCYLGKGFLKRMHGNFVSKPAKVARPSESHDTFPKMIRVHVICYWHVCQCRWFLDYFPKFSNDK